MNTLQTGWGQLTRYGDAALESHLSSLLKEISTQVKQHFDESSYRALLLTGGYGRGEGGVERRDGKTYAHNNMDLIWISPYHKPEKLNAIKRDFDLLLKPLSTKYGIDLDSFIISEFKLRNLPHLVMIYDMCHGHKTVLGDPGFLTRQFCLEPADILPSDVRNLMINRGALFLINQALLKKSHLTDKDQRTIIKHAVKGMIGYGDAFLFSKGQYHWSYAEKQKRMRQIPDASSELKALYEEAVSFRFEPDYSKYDQVNLAAWQARFLKIIPEIHLAFERWRLNRPGLEWSQYLTTAFEHELGLESNSLKLIVKKIRHLTQKKPAIKTGSKKAQLGYQVMGPFDVLATVFPAIAFDLVWPEVASYLGQSDLHAFLKAWGTSVDNNLPDIFSRHGLDPKGVEIK